MMARFTRTRQVEMLHTMLDMYREHGWLPKWELYGRETLTRWRVTPLFRYLWIRT